ncbi:hypothetical protein CPELA_01325 [Corynebacterium pelargi]|uniref:Uncharacterized protein n=1 Tax=Corynebacterium pelargi TaxID=1471400 RepID=A0A410W6H6_9CORY|nr:hypothetical protein CPELA_01325 [Corynebacterium pelargi]
MPASARRIALYQGRSVLPEHGLWLRSDSTKHRQADSGVCAGDMVAHPPSGGVPLFILPFTDLPTTLSSSGRCRRARTGPSKQSLNRESYKEMQFKTKGARDNDTAMVVRRAPGARLSFFLYCSSFSSMQSASTPPRQWSVARFRLNRGWRGAALEPPPGRSSDSADRPAR